MSSVVATGTIAAELRPNWVSLSIGAAVLLALLTVSVVAYSKRRSQSRAGFRDEPRPRVSGSRYLCSLAALTLATALWTSVLSGAGQPLRALVVVAFLVAPALAIARFLGGLGVVETVVFSFGAAVTTWGLAALLTFAARQEWTAESALVTVSGIVGCVSGVDLLRGIARQWRAPA